MSARIITITILISLFSVHAAVSKSDGSCFSKGSKYLSAGVSISKFGGFAAIDIGLHDLLSAGAVVGHTRYREYNGWKYRNYPLFGRVALHPLNFSFLADLILIRDNVDMYGGIAIGYTAIDASWDGISTTAIGEPPASGISIGEYLGIRIAINQTWHLFIEDCASVTNFSVGVGRWF